MRLLRYLFGLVLLIGLAGVGFVALTLWYFNRDLPDYSQLGDYQPPVVTRIQAGDGRLLAEYATEKRVFVPVKAMPPLVTKAFLAAEDKNFYTHPGVDFEAMIRAGLMDVVRHFAGRRPVGASTITQQVAKNFLVGNELSIQRKIREALLALKMEKVLSKDRILELYLNEIYLGAGNYGVAAAALNYFNKSLDDLSLGEMAYLAALPKAPNNYNPTRNPEGARERRDYVLGRMVEAGFITPDEAKKAEEQPVTLHKRDETEVVKADYFAEEVRRELVARYGDKDLYQAGLSVRVSLDPKLQTYADQALRQALIAYDRRHGYRGAVGHLDIRGDWWTKLASLALPAGADEVSWRLAVVLSAEADGATIGFRDQSTGRIPLDELKWAKKPLDEAKVGPPPRFATEVLAPGDLILVEPLKAEPPKDNKTKAQTVAAGTAGTAPPTAPAPAKDPLFGLRQIPAVSGALVALDPHTGRVLAMSGGFSYEMSQFNRATQAKRQTGSAIKPFIYLSALDKGYTPSSVILDAPITIDLGPGQEPWSPKNFDNKVFGPTTIRVGLEQSHDLMTVRLGQAIGLDAVGSTVERFGIMDHMPREYSMLLGAGETTVLKLTTAFAMIDNGGRKITPTFIDRVQDRNGTTIYRADQRPCAGCNNVAWQHQDPPDVADTREQIEDPTTCYQITHVLEGVIERGTGRVIASVGKPLAGKTGTSNGPNDTWFVGYSPNLAVGVFVGFDQPVPLGGREQGATVAAPAFRDFMAAALQDTPGIPFRVPPGVRMTRVNATSGRLASYGEKNVIFEAFKPGTEPPSGDEPSDVTVSDTPQYGGGPDAPLGPDTDLGASGVSALPPGAPQPLGATVTPLPTPGLAPRPVPTRTAPSAGTGGLY
jgi:penicillin-binding protein 1A